jgi:hypothetical protein
MVFLSWLANVAELSKGLPLAALRVFNSNTYGWCSEGIMGVMPESTDGCSRTELAFLSH